LAGVFDELAERYDGWFDSPEGKNIFRAEVVCLRELMGEPSGRWLEVGVGTGRFAEALGIREGVDPSGSVLTFAAGRGIRTRVGYGENLPYPDSVFDGVLMVVTICFLADPEKALEECRRVLKESGRLLVGLVPADTPWGERYARQGREGHPFYSAARFYTCGDVYSLVREAGFTPANAVSCLFNPPEEPLTDLSNRDGIVPGAGFVAMEFVKRG